MSILSDNLADLDLEWRLTIASRIDCECAPYFASRRGALLPAIARRAAATDSDAIGMFADYARRVHARHLAGHSLSVEVG